jgi:hypothetical protein
MHEKQAEPLAERFSEQVDSAISGLTDQIETQVRRESEALEHQIHNLVDDFLDKSGLTYQRAINVEHADEIAVQIYKLCRAVAKRASQERIRAFIEKFGQKILQEASGKSKPRD